MHNYILLFYLGAFGVDFSVPSDPETYEKDLLLVNRGLLKYGTTSYCPTIVSSSASVYHKVRSHAPLIITLFDTQHSTTAHHNSNGRRTTTTNTMSPDLPYFSFRSFRSFLPFIFFPHYLHYLAEQGL